MKKAVIAVALIASSCGTAPLFATETENHQLSILPAPGPVTIDGKANDWDLTGGVFVCGDVERLRDQFSVWIHAMYDGQALYILARWQDPTPLNNPGMGPSDYGFNGDCLQLRFIVGHRTDKETITWWTCWRDRKGKDVIDRDGPERGIKLPKLSNALAHGARQAFQVNADGRGYVQELRIPWKLLSSEGKAMRAGDSLRMTVEPNFTAGQFGRITIKDIFDANVAKPDRIFTFTAFDQWGAAVLQPRGSIEPAAVRLADGRTFAVGMRGRVPVVDWTGVIRKFEWRGFKPIRFTMPKDGYVSLNVSDDRGVVVRQLLNADFRPAGEHTVRWDGLATPIYRTPGQPVAAGAYRWQAVAHPAVNLKFRGWACDAARVPWEDGPTSTWGGDHGTPSSCVTDGQRMYLAWNGAEGGRHLLGTDFDGNVLWGLRNTTGAGDPEVIAVDDGTLFVLHQFWPGVQPVISRVSAADGSYTNWQGRDSAILPIAGVWGTAAEMPDHFDGLDARHGKLYATCSDASIRPGDIVSWKGLIAKLQADTPLARGIWARIHPATKNRLADFLADKVPQAAAFRTWAGGPAFDTEVFRELNGLLKANTLLPDAGRLSEQARAAAHRRSIDRAFAPAIKPLKTGWFVVLDGQSGKLLRTWPLELGGFVRAAGDTTVYVIVDNSKVVSVNPDSGVCKDVITGLHGARCLATDASGRIYVSMWEPAQQVAVFTAEGREVGRIGRAGGRAPLGPFQPDGMLLPFGLAVDPHGKLWVMERDYHPKRVSVWNLSDGQLVEQFFGPCHYGASGGAVNPRDPNLMVGEGCEWRIDPTTGRDACVGVVDRMIHDYACYRQGANGRLYLFAVAGQRDGWGVVRIFERVGDGRFALKAVLWPGKKRQQGRPTSTVAWTDTNGNGREDPGELEESEGWLTFTGSNRWSLNIGLDCTLYGLDSANGRLEELPLAGFTPGGAPHYRLADRKVLPASFSRGYQLNYGCAIPDAEGKRLLVNLYDERLDPEPNRCWNWVCFDLATGRRLWSYPNPWFQVHGSHHAAAPEIGLIRGAYGPIGIAKLPVVGTVWAINGNLGEWYLLSGDGFFLSTLFQSDPFKWRWPEKAQPGVSLNDCPAGGGQEDFGGSMTQADDGKLYVQCGAHSLRNVEIQNLDRSFALAGGEIRLTAADVERARKYHDAALQEASGTKSYSIERRSPAFTGNIDADFAGCDVISYQKNDSAKVRTVATYDGKLLYLAWDVCDNSPWLNGAKDIAQMYASGDTVDFQVATDPQADPRRTEAAAGDLRLSIGPFHGKPAAVLYRPVSEVKKPRSFSSGVIAGYQVDFVGVLSDVRIEVKVRPDKQGYTVEASVPVAALGLSPRAGLKLRGDFGVTYGDPAGQRTQLRSYWNNQQTGLVADIVFELKLVPSNWGELIFK